MNESLPDLIRGYGARLPDKLRVYAVQQMADCGTVYVIANSPGQAALLVCDVERVSDKDLVRAAFEALTKGDN